MGVSMRWQGIFAWFFPPLFEKRTPAAQASVDAAISEPEPAEARLAPGVAGAHFAPRAGSVRGARRARWVGFTDAYAAGGLGSSRGLGAGVRAWRPWPTGGWAWLSSS